MKALFIFLSVLGAFLADLPSAWKPWVTETNLRLTLSRSADELTRYFDGASTESWLQFVDRLTPKAKIHLSLFGREVRLDRRMRPGDLLLFSFRLSLVMNLKESLIPLCCVLV